MKSPKVVVYSLKKPVMHYFYSPHKKLYELYILVLLQGILFNVEPEYVAWC